MKLFQFSPQSPTVRCDMCETTYSRDDGVPVIESTQHWRAGLRRLHICVECVKASNELMKGEARA